MALSHHLKVMGNRRSKWLAPQWLVIGVVILAIGGYALARSWDLIAGPSIHLFSPAADGPITEPLIILTGEVKRISSLSLNGRQIFTREDGTFREALLLLPGYNIIVLEAKDRFGRRAVKRLTLINNQS